jgi:hypothetical protein
MMFEGEGLLVLKDGFSGFVMLWSEKAVIEWAALFGVPFRQSVGRSTGDAFS